MTDVELRDELMTLLVAGHETTATSLAWALYWIHHRPQVRVKTTARVGCPRRQPRSECDRAIALFECGLPRNTANLPSSNAGFKSSGKITATDRRIRV
jgi:cytochrome P450